MRVQDYRYGTHFGGVLYLFVRGVRAAWSRTGAMPGVFFHRPPEDDIRLLNRLLDTPTAAAIP
jgi:exodeoxyribonuclease V beta subunit